VSDGAVVEKPLKIAVYSISKNEAKHVKRFCDAAKEADLIVIADTGSTDDTVTLARKAGVVVHEILVTPWRFDVARNTALSLVPGDVDVCVSMDLDEILQPGWRDVVERAWKGGATRIAYNFDNGGGNMLVQNKIHSRSGYIWRWACHEWPMPDRIKEVVASVDFTMAVHKPDLSKSRQHYLDLLYTCAVEEPMSARHSRLYAAELHGNRFFEQAISEFNRFLNLDECKNPCERGYAYRMMSRAAHCMGDSPGALDYARKCVTEDPSMRESWCTLAWECGQQRLWVGSLNAANAALKIEKRGDVYLTENNAWGWLPHGLAAFALSELGMSNSAIEQAEAALNLGVDVEASQEKLKLILNPPEPEHDQ
jgi:hypothetical protein